MECSWQLATEMPPRQYMGELQCVKIGLLWVTLKRQVRASWDDRGAVEQWRSSGERANGG
jgi:hypothetical protein